MYDSGGRCGGRDMEDEGGLEWRLGLCVCVGRRARSCACVDVCVCVGGGK